MNSEAEKNSDNLSQVSGKLSDRVSRSCNCWIWLMLVLIMIVFIMMVLFMKLFPKNQYNSSGVESDEEPDDAPGVPAASNCNFGSYPHVLSYSFLEICFY